MILFITRKFPPSVGGMQRLSQQLVTAVSGRARTRVIKWGGSQIWLPLFIPYALVRALWILASQSVDIIHIGDPVLAPLGVLLRAVGRRPVVVNAHGLDVVYPNRLYQLVIPACMGQLDSVICISEHTRQLCLDRGIEAQRTHVIPVGVDVDRLALSLSEDERQRWAQRWRLASHPRHILLTVGRLVPRKGVFIFVSEVLPKLTRRRDDWIYLVVGEGPDRDRIEAAVRNQELETRVRVLGQVSDQGLRAAYALADLFVMPNVPVPGDIEGFGLVTLEARAAGLPIVASALEGITDSFETVRDGTLVPPGDAEAFLEAIGSLLEAGLTREDRLRRRNRTASRYGWSRIAQEYLAVFRDVQAAYHQGADRA